MAAGAHPLVAAAEPGLAAAATHGIIRTSHAARSLAADQTNERVAELARGMAYWAAPTWKCPGRLAPRAA